MKFVLYRSNLQDIYRKFIYLRDLNCIVHICGIYAKKRILS